MDPLGLGIGGPQILVVALAALALLAPRGIRADVKRLGRWLCGRRW